MNRLLRLRWLLPFLPRRRCSRASKARTRETPEPLAITHLHALRRAATRMLSSSPANP